MEVGGVFEGVYDHPFSFGNDLSWHVWLKHTVVVLTRLRHERSCLDFPGRRRRSRAIGSRTKAT